MTPNIVTVTPETHKNTKIRTDIDVAFAEKVHVVPVVLTEFADVAANCPIVFVHDETPDRLRVAAMLGLEVEKNLFYKDGEWDGTHIPMNIGRIPFAFGPLEDGKTLAAALDMSNDRVNEEEGTPLFDDDGKPTEYFQRVNNYLATLFEGEVATQKFVAAMQKHDILNEFRLIMEEEGGKQQELVGMFTPNAQALQNLSEEAILELNKEGFLAAAIVAVQSMAQIKRLVKMHNQRSDRTIKGIRMEMVGADQKAA